MKKAVAAFLAVVCAAATAVEAGAYDITHCKAEWDPDTDMIFYRDLDTNEIVAVEDSDGYIMDYYPEYYEPAEETAEEPEPEPDPEPITDPWAWLDPQPTEESQPTEEEWWYPPEQDTEEVQPYIVPDIEKIDAKETSLAITATVTNDIKFDRWALYKKDWSNDEQVVQGTSRYDYDDWYYGIDISVTGLTPGEEYEFQLVLYKNTVWGEEMVGDVEFSAQTVLPMFKTRMLTPVPRQNSINFMAVIDSRSEADGFIVQKYSDGKWVTVEKNGSLSYYYNGDYYYDMSTGDSYNFSVDDVENIDRYDLKCASYTATDLKSMTQYKYRIRFFQKVGKNKKKYIYTVTASATTLMAAPELDLGATAKKAKLSWDKVKGADGYEVYVMVSDDTGSSSGDGYYYYDGWYYYDYGTSWFNADDYKKLKTIKGGSSTSASYNIKGNKTYTYCVRAYKGSGKKKVYSEYSQTAATNSTKAILNGLNLKQKSTGLGDYDLGLVKSALKQCVNDKMSNYEKAQAVYDYVHNVAQYEYDINKVSLDSIRAILSDHAGQCYQYAVTYQAMMKYLGFDMKLIGGKTASGGPHWWNEMVINGTPRMFDPQVGGRFCILYDQLGSRMVTKEKTVD